MTVHLRLPTSFCCAELRLPDGLRREGRSAVAELDAHAWWSSSTITTIRQVINAGLAADAGYRGTFGHEAEDEPRRAAGHVPAQGAHRGDGAVSDRAAARRLARQVEILGAVRLCATCPTTRPPRRCCAAANALGLSTAPDAFVMVDHDGQRYAADDVPMGLRRARSTRISIDGNAHFCRGLLRTRYPDDDASFCPRIRPDSPEGSTAMSTMRAVQVVGYHTNLEMTEVPVPEPTGPFDVIVKIGGAGVCRTDLHILEGQWAEKTRVAAAVHDRPRERRLGARGRHRGHQRRGGRQGDPAPADHLRAVPRLPVRRRRALREQRVSRASTPTAATPSTCKTTARSVVKIDDSLEPADVAALADAGLTAYHAAAKAARRLGPRDGCVVIGAGGLGHIGIQVLKALSRAELVVVDRNPDAVKLAVAIGADHGVVADGTQVEQVLDLTGGHGAEAVVDFVGEGGATARASQMLRRAGNYYVVGYGENINVPTIDIISTEINFIGNLVGSYNDLCDLMVLAARARSRCTPRSTRSTTSSRPSTISTPATCAAARS